MATILFNEIIFGPIKSRRLGVSLGINLLPISGKVCSFDCLYCECGLNEAFRGGRLPKTAEVLEALETKLATMKKEHIVPDVITFAGNGEPTMHPDFALIIDKTIELRDQFFPAAKVSVLSNATGLDKPDIFNALLKVDNAILKLDSAFDDTIQILDRPSSKTYTVRHQVDMMKAFKGKLIIQTLFTKGQYKGQSFDNTTEKEVTAWIALIQEIAPESVMIYAIDRETAVPGVSKVSLKVLRDIAKRVKEETGIDVSVAG
ncbi:MAG TPA: radical SAM protein [Bacteroidales bacterium]|nr:radical SAM protein [Bacteroidales bacterium]